MTKVILHIGDTVTHSTLGEGVVTIVDDEFVTIKFATDELTFRLPDAFENGFLSSQDAEFVEEDEEEDEDWEEDENEEDEDEEEEEEDADDDESPAPTPAPTENNLGCLGSLVAILLPLLFFGSFAVLFFVLYSDGHFALFLILGIINVALIFISIPLLIKDWKKPLDPNATLSNTSNSGGLSPSAKFSAIMLGLWMGGRSYRKKHGSIFDSAHDSIFWQEKYRKDHDYDNEDW